MFRPTSSGTSPLRSRSLAPSSNEGGFARPTSMLPSIPSISRRSRERSSWPSRSPCTPPFGSAWRFWLEHGSRGRARRSASSVPTRHSMAKSWCGWAQTSLWGVSASRSSSSSPRRSSVEMRSAGIATCSDRLATRSERVSIFHSRRGNRYRCCPATRSSSNVARRGSPVTSKQAGDACTFAVTARFLPPTAAASSSCRKTSCCATSTRRSMPARHTSRSAIPIFSTVRATVCGS